ncbi:hypothetical protein AB1N83_011500 [Pleurotus pulmonarius]
MDGPQNSLNPLVRPQDSSRRSRPIRGCGGMQPTSLSGSQCIFREGKSDDPPLSTSASTTALLTNSEEVCRERSKMNELRAFDFYSQVHPADWMF